MSEREREALESWWVPESPVRTERSERKTQTEMTRAEGGSDQDGPSLKVLSSGWMGTIEKEEA